MMTVLIVLGILVNIAVPVGMEVKRRAEAVRVISDFNTIRGAGFDHYAGSGTYPRTGRWGQVPGELISSLPAGFAFRYKSVEYRWRRWSLPNGTPRNRRQKVLVGLQLRTADTALLLAIKRLYQGEVAFGRKRRIVLVIQ